MDVHAASCTLAVISEKGRKLRDFPVETVRRQNFSDDWIVLSVRPNDKAPEVPATPGASFLGSGGGIREQPAAAKASRRPASLATPDLRVVSADREVGGFAMLLGCCGVRPRKCLSWIGLV